MRSVWAIAARVVRNSGAVDSRVLTAVSRRLLGGCYDRDAPDVMRSSPWDRLRHFVMARAPEWEAASGRLLLESGEDSNGTLWDLTIARDADNQPHSTDVRSVACMLAAIVDALEAEIISPPKDLSMLACWLARVIEDETWFVARKTVFSRWGLEDVLDERMQLRAEVLRQNRALVSVSDGLFKLDLVAPGELEDALKRQGLGLTDDQRSWVRAERRGRLLEWMRDAKVDRDGNIRWYIDRATTGLPILRAHGTDGHWLVANHTSAPFEEFAVKALLQEVSHDDATVSPPSWQWGNTSGGINVPGVIDLSPVRNMLPGGELLQQVPSTPNDALGTLDLAVSKLTNLSMSASSAGLSELLAEANRWLDYTGLGLAPIQAPATQEQLLLTSLVSLRSVRQFEKRVRLIYLTGGAQHPQGGVPEVGMWFLADRLERMGVRADRMVLDTASLDRRLPELLGATHIGFSVNLANMCKIEPTILLLRNAGFTGHILIGGPYTLYIDELMDLPGWSAIIRGEAEDLIEPVLQVLDLLDAGDSDQALRIARGLRGVAFRTVGGTVLCDTAHRPRAAAIVCPLPSGWQSTSRGTLQMNFTRGCPYECAFCPNHQGKQFRSSAADSMWDFASLAVADRHPWPPDYLEPLAAWLDDRLPEAARSLSVVVKRELLLEAQVTVGDGSSLLRELAHPLEQDTHAAGGNLVTILGTRGPQTVLAGHDSERVLTRLQLKELILRIRLVSLAGTLARRRSSDTDRFIIETSEDNTLVNHREVTDFLDRRRLHSLDRHFVFNPGQNSISDLTRGGKVRTDFVDAIARDNPCAIAFGVDGTSNPVLRQNSKPAYTIGDAIRVNAAVLGRGIRVENNYILVAPETRFEEVVEAFMLYVALPIPWRDYGGTTNIRVVTESGTLATDEARILFPRASEPTQDYVVPLRDPRAERLLHTHDLRSENTAGHELAGKIWEILLNDSEVRAAVPKVVARWMQTERDDEIVALGALLQGTSGATTNASGRVDDILKQLHFVAERIASDWRQGRYTTFVEYLQPLLTTSI